MTKTQANKIIRALFDAMPVIHVSFSDVQTKMFDMELKAEKEHRYNRDSVKGFSASDAARYFTIKHLHDGKDESYTVKDILHIRNECLYGMAYAVEYAEQFKAWFELVDNSQFKDIDYSDLMKD